MHSIESDSTWLAQLTSAFAWILPLGGVVMTYPVGWMLDNLAMWQCVFALSFAGLVHSCLSVLEVKNIIYTVAVSGLGLSRPD